MFDLSGRVGLKWFEKYHNHEGFHYEQTVEEKFILNASAFFHGLRLWR